MALKRETRARLLSLVRAGHDFESACAQLELKPAELRKDEALMRQAAEAFKTGTAKLRAQVLDGALRDNDLRILSQLLAERTEREAGMEPERGGGDLEAARQRLFGRLVAQLVSVEAMRTELLGEVGRHATVEVRSTSIEIIPPAAAKPVPLDAMPVMDEQQPLPASRAPALRPRLEREYPAPGTIPGGPFYERDVAGGGSAVNGPGSPWSNW